MLTTLIAAALLADPLSQLPQADQDALALLGSGVVTQSSTIGPVVNPAKWIPLQDSVHTFVRTSGTNTGQVESIRLKGATTSQSKWTQEDPAHWTRYLNPTSTGIRVPSAVNVPNAVISKYAPAQPLILSDITPGTVVSETVAVKVYDLNDPSTVSYTGTLKMDYQDLGGFKVQVPAGTYDTRLIKVTYDGKVGPASVQDSAWVLYAQGVGPVAFVNYKDVSAFLFYDKESRFGAVLQSVSSTPQPAPTPQPTAPPDSHACRITPHHHAQTALMPRPLAFAALLTCLTTGAGCTTNPYCWCQAPGEYCNVETVRNDRGAPWRTRLRTRRLPFRHQWNRDDRYR